MNNRFNLLLFWCFVLTCGRASALPGDTAGKGMFRSRTSKIDVKHQALNLRFDWKKKKAFGKTDITLAPLEPIRKITLDAVQMTIRSIKMKGKSLSYKYDGSDKPDGLEIELARFYTPNEELTLQISYETNYVNDIDPNNLSGSTGKGLRFSQPTSTDPLKPWEVYSVGEFEGNRYWFPCFDAPDDWRTTELTATVDSKLTVVSNGNLISKKTNTDGTLTFHYKADVPYANHLTSVVVSEYQPIYQKVDAVTLQSFGYKKEVAETEASVERLPDMMRYFSTVTGLPFPHKTYSQAFVQDLPGWMCGSTMAIITENMVDDALTHADFFYLWDLTEAEALASQWFGNAIGCQDWSEIWLNRAFSHYFNAMFDEHKNGKDEFLSYVLSFDHASYLADWNGAYRRPVVTRNFTNVAEYTTDNYSYGRGAEVLHMLRKHLGEETWWKAIRLYVAENKGKPVTTGHFIRAVNKVSPEPMDWFFEQWVYKIGHPIFEITQEFDEARGQLILTVKQVQKPDTATQYPQVQYFQGAVWVEIDGETELVSLKAREINHFTFLRKQKPQLVHFDFESTWIKEIQFDKPLDDLLYQLQNDRDILGRYWALGEIGKRTADPKTTSGEKEKIKTTFRQTLSGNAYWRLKTNVLFQLRKLMPGGTNQALLPDDETKKIVLHLVENEKSWLKASALNFLAATKDTQYVSLYIKALADESDRVINAAAVGLGGAKSAAAFPALEKLTHKPSMKSQSLLSALAGLRELGDPRGFDIAYKALANSSLPRWRLPTGSVWDYRVVATTTIASLGSASKAYPLIAGRFQKSLAENDLSGLFNNALLISLLGDPRGKEVFDPLKKWCKGDANALRAATLLEEQFLEKLKK